MSYVKIKSKNTETGSKAVVVLNQNTPIKEVQYFLSHMLQTVGFKFNKLEIDEGKEVGEFNNKYNMYQKCDVGIILTGVNCESENWLDKIQVYGRDSDESKKLSSRIAYLLNKYGEE